MTMPEHDLRLGKDSGSLLHADESGPERVILELDMCRNGVL